MSTGISYVDETCNPVVGCSPVSEGCVNCYAQAFAGRELCKHHQYVTEYRGNHPQDLAKVWDGSVRYVSEAFEKPLRWRNPRTVLVPSMGDLLHPLVDPGHVAAMFGVMAACPQHTFLVLTKRAERLVDWMAWVGPTDHDSIVLKLADSVATWSPSWDATHGLVVKGLESFERWPLPNVLIGVTVENQARADERIPLLGKVAAHGWRVWVSFEPLLGDIRNIRELMSVSVPMHAYRPLEFAAIGGETGPCARECSINWLRSVIQQCRRLGARVHLKQFGANCDWPRGWKLKSRTGADPEEWPHDMRRSREVPRCHR